MRIQKVYSYIFLFGSKAGSSLCCHKSSIFYSHYHLHLTSNPARMENHLLLFLRIHTIQAPLPARSICSTSLSQKYPSPFPGHISPPTQKCTFSGVTHPPLSARRRHHHNHTHFSQALSWKTRTSQNQICNAGLCYKTLCIM